MWNEEVRKEVEGGVVAVESGTSDAVVLDCPYHLNEEDTEGLHLAWYHPRFANPVYQWIPNNKPRVSVCVCVCVCLAGIRLYQ